MSDISNCIIDKSLACLLTWGLPNFLWDVLTFLFVLVFVRFCIPVVQAIFIAKKILKNNRYGNGRGYGTQAADIFVDVWNNSKDYSCLKRQGNLDGSGYTNRTYGEICKPYLIPKKLVEVFEELGVVGKKVRGIKNIRNRLVYMMVAIGLCFKYDEKLSFYKK